MSGHIIAKRLQEEFGVVFTKHTPTRAHYQKHGNLNDTFLVSDVRYGRGKSQYSTQLNWEWCGRSGVEIILADPARKLARAKLKLEFDDSFSGYGLGLCVSEAEPGGNDK